MEMNKAPRVFDLVQVTAGASVVGDVLVQLSSTGSA